VDSAERADSARQAFIHRRLSARFDKHREKLETHRSRGGVWAAAVEKLERQLSR